jgi:hypothetical protein
MKYCFLFSFAFPHKVYEYPQILCFIYEFLLNNKTLSDFFT